MNQQRCVLYTNMVELWVIHVSLTREVILAAKLKTPNLNSSLDALLQNQKDLGDQLIKYGYNGRRYTRLLTEHINIAVKIVQDVLSGLDPKKDIELWYENADDISKFLSRDIKGIRYEKIKHLFDEHLKCTLDEATLIIGGKYAESVGEYYTCIRVVKHIAHYISSKMDV